MNPLSIPLFFPFFSFPPSPESFFSSSFFAFCLYRIFKPHLRFSTIKKLPSTMAPKKDTAASKKANESAPAEAPAAPATTTTKKSASTHPSYKGTCFFT